MIDEYGVIFMPGFFSVISEVWIPSLSAALGSKAIWFRPNPRRLMVACDSGFGGAGESARASGDRACKPTAIIATATAAAFLSIAHVLHVGKASIRLPPQSTDLSWLRSRPQIADTRPAARTARKLPNSPNRQESQQPPGEESPVRRRCPARQRGERSRRW